MNDAKCYKDINTGKSTYIHWTNLYYVTKGSRMTRQTCSNVQLACAIGAWLHNCCLQLNLPLLSLTGKAQTSRGLSGFRSVNKTECQRGVTTERQDFSDLLRGRPSILKSFSLSIFSSLQGVTTPRYWARYRSSTAVIESLATIHQSVCGKEREREPI